MRPIPLALPPTPDRRRRFALGVSVVAVAALIGPAATPAAADPVAGPVADLRADISALLDSPELQGATSGVTVRSLDSGELLYGNDAATPLIPASNAKLLTSAAALDVLGPDHTFRTTVDAGEDPGDGVVEGDLILRGTGDPTLTATVFDALAAEVAGSGVTLVTGDLLADDTWFDDQRLGADWDPTDEPYYYASQISALTVAANSDFDTGVVNATAAPGVLPGLAVDPELVPAGANLQIVDQATTGEPDSVATLGVNRAPGTNTFGFTGSLPAGGSAFQTLRTVHEPTDHAAHLFAAALEAEGVEIAGEVRRGSAPGTVHQLVEHESMPLQDLLVPFMKLSNNGHAEILVKAIGHEALGEGTWEAGLAEVEEAINRLGVTTDDLELTDGSGLSHTNLVRADLIDDLLTEATDQPWFEVWKTSLPLAGEADRLVGGTLAQRMRGTAAEANVYAKTGSLTGASALSGYVTTADGEELAFSIVNNGYPGIPPRAVQDAIAVRLAEFTRDDQVRPLSRSTTQYENEQSYTGDLECTWSGAC
ncbi:D-alanyl-D-alanine carboxypeptidase/D-alanyl-D-alanine endopeptidase [Nocardiopsis ansamitocini]|uniref:D-alanyl-D-alanine carboxypeptidase DacC n=1 Tax=Nocardiopsis ansamitocini TaxID=1670832 RepID=A0A9W6UIM3_9ACTN|nr:D-alanyl-D-alanine carboxypeptidase/D-alanyl-D-alanine-endopeptidase [Nocardiopsis ansamitocini]GLU47869.1 D-alanyl-D-alanine carboxypeptidase DacC [Nocardiopsis ansamitocini]